MPTCRSKHLSLLACAPLAVGLLLGGCATQTAETRSVQELRRATEHYAQLIREMNPAATAAAFTVNGELQADQSAPVRGRAAIEHLLASFRKYRVLSETLTTDHVQVSGNAGHVTGRYEQQVRLPSGKVVTAKGSYTADWLRAPDGTWQIQHFATRSDPSS